LRLIEDNGHGVSFFDGKERTAIDFVPPLLVEQVLKATGKKREEIC
jgi:hypothetical protein